jgi:uncharacterized protein
MPGPSPIGTTERIQEIDIIRGFALFGVLWLNLAAQSHTLAPEGMFDDLATARLDAIIEPIADIFIANKAMTLFSLLFGYGFAMIISRLESRGAAAGRIFLRRTSILFVIGIIDIWFLWIGDILHVYALMGFILFLTRKWSDRSLLITGLLLALFSHASVEIILQYNYDEPYPWWSIYDAGAERRFEIFQGNSYSAYVVELWRASWEEMWGTPDYIPYCTTSLGRFMLGAWIFRQGWLQRTDRFRLQFRRWAAILIPGGIVLSLVSMKIDEISDATAWVFDPVPQLVLALGYGALVVSLCQSEAFRNAMGGVAAIGRTALTNYLLQGVMYVFVLYGFGFGLLNMLGATTCLLLAVLTFIVQVQLSHWWVRRFQFGPMEWVWRSLTYGQMQPMRRAESGES